MNQYSPYAFDLSETYTEFSSDSGRATHINFPYFNLEHGDGGTILAIGWAGTWNARFSSDGNTTTYVARSLNGMRLYLKPGEKIRTALFLSAPRAVLYEWQFSYKPKQKNQSFQKNVVTAHRKTVTGFCGRSFYSASVSP